MKTNQLFEKAKQAVAEKHGYKTFAGLLAFGENPDKTYYSEAVETMQETYKNMIWQPIETAPKGVYILVYTEYKVTDVALDESKTDKRKFLNRECKYVGKPTHWMHLPDAPKFDSPSLPFPQQPDGT